MEGKKKKRKAGKIILLAMSFVMTIVLTFTVTYAWFFDSDWASKYVTMAGSVGIEIREELSDGSLVKSSGAGSLHFDIATTLAYPGQAIDINASVYNNGGMSANYNPTTNPNKGSECYVRARFEVYTDIGFQETIDRDDYDTTEEYNAAVAEAEARAESEKDMNADSIYKYLNDLISGANTDEDNTATYGWIYHQSTGAKAITTTGTSAGTLNYYLEGESGYVDGEGNTVKYTAANSSTLKDKGYYYLCMRTGTTMKDTLYPLTVGDDAAFLWNSTFIIPWTLTNYSADKHIFIAVTFQAIQTFIPIIDANTGEFDDKPNNQDGTYNSTTEKYEIDYDNPSVQTVFNTCAFDPIETEIMIDGVKVDFAKGNYGSATTPTA